MRCASTPTPRSRAQLLGLYEDDFGPDYVDKRNAIIAAVTIDDAKRVAKRLLENAGPHRHHRRQAGCPDRADKARSAELRS